MSRMTFAHVCTGEVMDELVVISLIYHCYRKKRIDADMPEPSLYMQPVNQPMCTQHHVYAYGEA
jgi:hypothetical protein